jgi:AcrR family transcriptional regulator
MMATRARPAKREDAKVRRTRILEVAIRIIGQLGYHGFTVQDLAARCGLSNAGLLYHFPSKELLFDAVVEELELREIQALAPLIAAVEDTEDTAGQLGAFIDLLRAMVVRGSGSSALVRFYAVLQAESLDNAHPAHDSFKKREFAVLDLFAHVLAPHVPDPLSKARQMLALMDGLRLQWLRSSEGFDAVSEWIRAVTVLVPALAPLREGPRTDSLAACPDQEAPPAPAREGRKHASRARRTLTKHAPAKT